MEVYGISELVGALAQRTRDVNRVIRKREYLEEFRNLWNAEFSYYGDYYDLYCKVRRELGLEPHSIKDFDFLFSVYTVRAKEFKDALSEWAELVADWVCKH